MYTVENCRLLTGLLELISISLQKPNCCYSKVFLKTVM